MSTLNTDGEYDQLSKNTNVTTYEYSSVFVKYNSVITKSTMYFDIESDNSNYFDSTSKEEEEDTEDVLDEMSDEEKEDNKYLSIFDSNCVQFNEQIMILETVEEF